MENIDVDNLGDDVCDDDDDGDEDDEDDEEEDDEDDDDDDDGNCKENDSDCKALDLALIPPHVLTRFFATSWRAPAFQIFPRHRKISSQSSSCHSSSSRRNRHAYSIGSGYDHFMSRVTRCWWGSLLVHPISSVELTTAWPYFAHATFHEDAFHSDLRYHCW